MSDQPYHAPQMTPPATVEACRERLSALKDEIVSIRIQIATSDIRRQADRRSLDASWYHRAKTALRLKQQELALVSAQLARLNGRSPAVRRDRFKDALIEVLRAECDEERWQSALVRARALHEREEEIRG
jgi:hypothetical protein